MIYSIKTPKTRSTTRQNKKQATEKAKNDEVIQARSDDGEHSADKTKSNTGSNSNLESSTSSANTDSIAATTSASTSKITIERLPRQIRSNDDNDPDYSETELENSEEPEDTQQNKSSAASNDESAIPAAPHLIKHSNIIKYFHEFNKTGYIKKDNTPGIKIVAICNFCNKSYSDALTSTSNFWSHLQKHHRGKFDPNDVKAKQLVITEEKRKKLTQEEFDDLLVKCLVIIGGLSIRIVENEGFKNFMKHFWSRNLISRRSIVNNKFPSYIKSVTESFIKEIEQVDAISVTSDFWTDCRKRAFMGVTAHYIYDFRPKNFLLKLKHVTGTHSGANIEIWFKQIIEEYGITSKLYRVSTDNAKNMIAGFDFSLPGFEKTKLSTIESESSGSENESNIDEEHETDFNDSITEFCAIMFENKTKRLACFNHTLQLTVLDGIKASKSIKKALSKAQNIANLSHQNKTVAEHINSLGLSSIPLKCATRWNGHLNLIKIVLKISPNLTEVLSTSHQLTFEEKKQLAEFIEILEPFLVATKKCEAEKTSTVNLVIPSILSIYNYLISKNVDYNKDLKLALIRSLETRFKGILNFSIDYDNEQRDIDVYAEKSYLIATFLDPNFKLFWCDDIPNKLSLEKEIDRKSVV